jgi:transposase
MQLTEQEYKLLREIQQNEKHKKNYVKVTVLLMLHLGNSLENISISLGISTQTVKLYIQTYKEKGLDYYLENHYLGYSGKLTAEQKEVLKEELSTNLYATSQAIADFIFLKFGVKYTSTGLVPLLHRLGFSYQKIKSAPCEVDTEVKKEGDVVYFADGVHPQHNTKSDYAWIEKGKEQELLSVSGRSRVNINAVMNAENPCEVVMVESKSVNAESTFTLYKKLEALHPEAKNSYVICDNARYYKNKVLNENLQGSKIKQVFLPPYSPNLNLIERLWKFMRKKVMNHHFYRRFDEFKKAIFDFFENIKDFEAELKTLISWNFHIPEAKPINL